MGECFLFSKGSSGTSGCARRHMGRFLEYDHGRRPSTKKYYPERHHPSVTFVQVVFWENERDKDNQHGVELALLSFLPRSQSTPLTSDQPVVLLSNIEFGRYWFGVLPLHIGYLFETGYYKEPKSSPTWDFPRYI
jgi:hypothetical protein